MANDQQQSKMWSGRFREPLDPHFESWQRSLPFDWRLLPQEIAASKAHARTIAAAGILTAGEADRIASALAAIGGKYAAKPHEVRDDKQAEDIHHFVELRLTEAVGDLGLKLHTGRSRNEQIATDLRLFVRDAIDATCAKLTEWALALLELADEVETSAMPSYTHLQRAEPVLVAHWLLAYVEMILRDISRFEDCRTRLNFCPLGSGAVAGATLALDRTPAPRQQHARHLRPRFRPRICAGRLDAQHSPLALSRRAHALLHCRIRLPRSARAVLHRLQRHAPEEESGPHRAAARQEWPPPRRRRQSRHTPQGSAPRLQQGHAGDPAARLRSRRHALRNP